MKVFYILAVLVLVVSYLFSFGFGFPAGTIFMLFAFGTAWFWGLVLYGLVLVLTTFVDLERGQDKHFWSATVWLFIVTLVLQFFSNVKVYSYIWNEPRISLIVGLVYVAGAVSWSIVKFRWLAKELLKPYYKLKQEFFTDHTITGDYLKVPIPAEFQDLWYQFLTAGRRRYRSCGFEILDDGVKVPANDHKAEIVGWMIYWPLSFIWHFIRNPFVRFFNWVFDLLTNLYQRVADMVTKDTKKDFGSRGEKNKTGR
jgi:hypothetical protein